MSIVGVTRRITDFIAFCLLNFYAKIGLVILIVALATVMVEQEAQALLEATDAIDTIDLKVCKISAVDDNHYTLKCTRK